MEPESVAKGKPSRSDLPIELQRLSQSVPEDLFLVSLRDQPARLQGFAFRFLLVLPLLNAEGKQVFTDKHISDLVLLFDLCCGGCLVTSSRSGAPYFGEYLPHGNTPVRDY